ncbi:MULTISPECIES: type II secretion system F family protein [Microbacterium]|uniref:type II secretion system F family protein n=1 Tax=Microbacterium TaxID=33882 RepID=UPI001EF55B6B|nr:type II secretion system F family protein [Microbacterium sp. KCTC 39802]
MSETVLRLAVLLQAGVSPARAWGHLARAGDPAAAHVVSSMDDGMPLAEAVAAAGTSAWREVGAACQVAVVVGAPLAESLRGLAVALRDAQEAADDVRVALAEPAGTARLMGWLPFVAVGLGAALGFDTFGTLLTQPLGIGCLVAGAALILLSHGWTSRLVRSAQAGGRMPGLDAELIAIALSGGVSIERARAVVREASALRGGGVLATRAGTRGESGRGGAGARGGPGGGAGAGSSGDGAAETGGAQVGVGTSSAGAGAVDAGAARGAGDDVDEVLALSRTAGVPAVELLRASAAHARHRARVDGRLRAAKLSSRLLLPLGVCTLPAFLLLGVGPMLLSVMSTMSVSL